jgi:dTDP-glucose pyrophosphorylase
MNNLLVPIAGLASRFIQSGYTSPKPLIMVRDKMMIDWAMSSLELEDSNIIFAVRKDHIRTHSIDEILKQKWPGAKIVVVDKITRGTLETCLLAEDYINNENGLWIYTPDVYIPGSHSLTVDNELDGFIYTFKANNPAHSYARLDDNKYVVEVAEKDVISDNAICGLYYFRHGNMFVKYAKEMIDEDITTNGEFYVAPIYNLMIRDNLRIKPHKVEDIHVLGTPEDTDYFVTHVLPRF